VRQNSALRQNRTAATISQACQRYRGDYKTPGGKLIATEFIVADGCLRQVVISGDFFLYPEEALASIAASLEGSPVTLDEAGYAALVQPALDAGVVLIGSSAVAIGAAVVRALSNPETE
jgi:lipoate-protein ligase A